MAMSVVAFQLSMHKGDDGLLRDSALGTCAGALGALVGIMVDRWQCKARYYQISYGK
ncbi:hypothetical protein BDZ91DRAFT_724963 [Kalaharituber pfeilii]|nr:hypothetical protein BDZ91DRAFT_724963 [Kalaharituber pfeilii]